MTASAPNASVVVATHGRAALLPRLVGAIAAQVADAGPVELVFVDDASPDATPEVLDDLAARHFDGLDIRVLRLCRNRGPARARNVGWRAARSEVVAFTDDDCVPRPGWLAALVRGLVGADLVQGRTVPDPSGDARSGAFSRTIEADGTTGRFETCNMAYRREVLERSGGFDERYRYPYGEDIDLALRAVASGAVAAYAPEAVVEHDVWPSSFRARLRDAVRHEGIVLTVRNHPGYRDRLYRGRWAKAAHPRALVAALGGAAVGAALSGRRGPLLLAGLVAALPYLHYRTKVAPLAGRRYRWPVVIPAALCADLVEVAVLARASLRYRTVVL